MYTNKVQRIALHFLFWIVFTLVFSFIFGYQSRLPYSFFLEHYLVSLVPFAIFTYLTIYFFVPKLLYSKRIFLFLLMILPVSIAFAVFKLVMSKYIFYRFFVPDIFHPDEWISIKLIFQNFIWIWIPTTIFAAIKFFKAWFITRNEKLEIEKKNLQSELQLLKAQLQPHFLFNTLNNLYVLALEKSDKTPDVVMKISELFHYVLYECDAREVLLEKEVSLINNYIELEKLRYDENLQLNFDIIGNIASSKIAPMLFFVLIENAFKHGARNELNKPEISLKLTALDNEVHFRIENTIPVDYIEYKQGKGVGLKNLKKRLNLLYPEKHKLKFENNENRFRVDLIIFENKQKT